MNPQTITVFTPASHQDVLALILQIAVLLLTARVFGELAERLNQPSVIGEILAGIILGPSLAGHFFPNIIGYIIPATNTQGYLIEAVSLIGAIFLLLLTGLETDLNLIRRHAKTALGVSFCGILVTFSSGFILGQLLPEYLLADWNERLVFSLFIATAMSISAIPVIAKVLIDLNLTRRDIGQTILAAGMCDDTVGWILLSIVAALASGDKISAGMIGVSVGTVLAFLLFSFTVGRWLTGRLIHFVQDKAVSKDKLFTLVVVMTFFWGAITQWLHLEAVMGAFIMGILIARTSRLPNSVYHKLESMALTIFAPIFFATAGLKVNIKGLMRPDLIGLTICLILVASLGKLTGTYLGARLIGRKDHWTALSFGAALNARGAMEIIVATIGLSLGILSKEMYSMIVVMAMATSLMTPTALRWVLRHVPPSREEAQRLQEEKLTQKSLIMNIRRVLVPMRKRENDEHLRAMQVIKSRILKNIGLCQKLSLTLLCADSKIERKERIEFLDSASLMFKDHSLTKKVIESNHVFEEILKESGKDYDLLVLGASSRPKKPDFVFSRFTDDLIRMAPCLSMVVHANKTPVNWAPNKILVPTNGSCEARTAVELAFLIASTGHETVKIINVIERDTDNLYEHIHDEGFRRRLKIAADMLKPLRELGELKGISVAIDAIPGPSTVKTILDTAYTDKMDLIIIGTGVRPASEHLFLGPQIETILRNSVCPVIALNAV